MTLSLPAPSVTRALRRGAVIPAHPLALTARRRLDERRQRALTRYYLDAGAGGVAVGVHTTQFAIRKPAHGLYRPVLELAAEAVRDREPQVGRRAIRVAGVCGSTRAAVREAGIARDCGYDIALVSLGGLDRATDDALLLHVWHVAEVLPVMGFYLQPAAGGRVLGYRFWRSLAELENLVAIKIAPFNRYQTLDVVRAVLDAGRAEQVALYTGNDDAIIADLLTPFEIDGRRASFVGGLLGHWAFGTRTAVHHFARCRRARRTGSLSTALLRLAAQVTDLNGAVFDARHGFRGCIPGIHEMLRRQGLLAGRWCLDPREELSPGQMEEIDRVTASYPHLLDDEFVRDRLSGWLR